jgi:tRNA-specific 2-thiouridylase
MQKVLVAMSGGVDSSTAAFLLQKQGCDVVGVTLRLWHANDDRQRPGGCCSLQDTYDAKRVCDYLRIPHYVLNMEQEFKDTVVEDFAGEYLAGRTPNPCIVCNEKIKFGLLMEKAKAIGFDLVATGHYARIEERGSAGGKEYLLKKGKDDGKDQSYVLYRLTRKELASLLLPLGEYTKKEIRALAIENGLPAAQKPESQEICFVDSDYASFLKSYVPEADSRIRPGPLVDKNGRRLGTHKGLAYYTIGQRSGLGLTTPEPVYVIRIDVAANTLVVGGKEDVYSKIMRVDRLNWVLHPPRAPFACSVKIRRMHRPAAAVVTLHEGEASVVFDEPQPSVTPGQAAVFYDNEVVAGGGIIS